jgi:hypothetical protein
MVSSSEREKEKREEREKRFCVCGNLSLWFSLGGWCIQMKAECRFPQDVGVSSPVFPVARKKVLNKISLSLERTLTDKTFIQIEKNIP